MTTKLLQALLVVMAVSACGVESSSPLPPEPQASSTRALDEPAPAFGELRRELPADVAQRGGAPTALPEWMHAGLWRRDDGVPADVRQIIFFPGHYTWWLGPRTDLAGELVLAGDAAFFTSGPLAGASTELSRAFSASCRVLTLDGRTLWSAYEVPACPWRRQLTPAECAQVGTYTKKYDAGGVTRRETLKLERDGFFIRTQEPAVTPAIVGEWDGGMDLSGWSFEPASAACD